MGSSSSSDTQNMKGLLICPYFEVLYNPGLHKSSDHHCEIDECDNCEKIRICHVSCDSSTGKLHRLCDDCVKRVKKNTDTK